MMFRVIAGGREGMRNSTPRMERKEIFFNFPSHMWEGNLFLSISHPACKRKKDFCQFPFPHEKKTIFYL